MIGLLQNWYADCVSALAYSIGHSHAKEDRELSAPYNDLARFIYDQWQRMPDFLRTPMLGATLLFDSLPAVAGFRRFHKREPGERATRWQARERSGPQFVRDLLRYHESLATMGLYSRLAGHRGEQDRAEPGQSTFGAPNQVLHNVGDELRGEIAVIGSGPGGAITACLLAEAGKDVLLIEEGHAYDLGSCAPFSMAEMIQKYRNGGQTVALGRTKIAYVEACCVGGGSEINSGLYHRTPAEILDLWRTRFRVEDLSEHDLRPHFEACERDLSVSTLPGPAPAASLKLHEGALALGWKSLEVPRWFRYLPGTMTKAAHTSSTGQRQSMTETYLPRFLRAGGKLLPNTRALSLRHESGAWQVRAVHLGRACLIRADTVYVCGGAVQTPLLLRRSGIGQHIGTALKLHPTIKVVAEFPEPVNAEEMGVPVHQVKEFSPRLSFGCSISSPPYVALGLLDHKGQSPNLGVRWGHMANYYAMISPEGSGTIRPVPGFRDALVKYGLTKDDMRNLAEGLKKLCTILLRSGATALYGSVRGAPVVRKLEDVQRLPDMISHGMASLMTIHLFSSCPMGEAANLCATDSFGKVRGEKNLFINDASLLCDAPGVNPQGTIMAIARRNTLHWLNQL